LRSIHTLKKKDGPPDEVERALIVEAAAGMTPSPKSWREAPLYFHAATIGRAANTLAQMDMITLTSMTDHGPRADEDHFIEQFAGYNKELGRPMVVLIDDSVVGKTGETTAQKVFHSAQQMKVVAKLCATMTDSASAAIDGQSKALNMLMDHWVVSGGCRIHVHNLTFEGPYNYVFGPADLYKPSVLMKLRSMRYLQAGHIAEEIALLREVIAEADDSTERQALEDLQKATLITDAVLTRWNTVSNALQWERAYGKAYAIVCRTQHDGLKTGEAKAREVYGNIGKWLTESPKLEADTTFCHAFCNTLFDPVYQRLIQADPEHGAAGFHSYRIARDEYDYDRKLQANCDGKWKTSDQFADFRQAVAALKVIDDAATEANGSLDDDERLALSSEKQAEKFFEKSALTLRRHSERWLRDLLFLSLGDDKALAIPLAECIVAACTSKPEGTPWSMGKDEGWWYRRGRAPETANYIYVDPAGGTYDNEEAAKQKYKEWSESESATVYTNTRAQDAMEVAVAAAIEKHDGEEIVIADNGTDSEGRPYGRRYELRPLLEYLTKHLKIEIVKQWPVPIPSLKRWITTNGDLVANDEMRDFLNAWPYGYPHCTHTTERAVKRIGVILKNKKRQRAHLTRQLHMGTLYCKMLFWA
jgi:hypothetical protein